MIYRAVAVNVASFNVPAYYAVEGPGPAGGAVCVQRFTTLGAAEGCAQMLNEAWAAGRESERGKGKAESHGVVESRSHAVPFHFATDDLVTAGLPEQGAAKIPAMGTRTPRVGAGVKKEKRKPAAVGEFLP